jgi:endonuclease I
LAQISIFVSIFVFFVLVLNEMVLVLDASRGAGTEGSSNHLSLSEARKNHLKVHGNSDFATRCGCVEEWDCTKQIPSSCLCGPAANFLFA